MLLGIDQGTTGTNVAVYDLELKPVARAYRELPNRYPRPGWVEQDPEDIVRTVVEAVGEVLSSTGGAGKIEAAGVANQGETVVAWDKKSGRALSPALVWSDGRAAEVVDRMADHAERVRQLTGLMLDEYFCAARFRWLLEHSEEVRRAARADTLCLGTLDAWLAHHLGTADAFTDHCTASRTQLLGLASREWETELLDLFGIERTFLPRLEPSLSELGELGHRSWGGTVPWRASVVDQPAALAGNGCFVESEIKATYGTGCFVVVNTGPRVPVPPDGLLASIAWTRADASCTYALDGGVFTAGTAIKWLHSAGIVEDISRTADLAMSVKDTGGVRFLPAFTGLGAPWWDGEAKGVFSGITSATTRAHLIRAVLDAIAFRVRDILEAVWKSGLPKPRVLRADGGLTNNRYLMQRQADILGIPVELGPTSEATATGAAALAAIQAGLLDEDEVRNLLPGKAVFEPTIPQHQREAEYESWLEWLSRARSL